MNKKTVIQNMAQYYKECIDYTGNMEDVVEMMYIEEGYDISVADAAKFLEEWSIGTETECPEMCKGGK